jgi:hypothetical protein
MARKRNYRINVRVGGAAQKPFRQMAGDKWITISGDGLPQDLMLRLGKAPDGRFVVTGLILGAFTKGAIEARHLREIRLPELIEKVAEVAASTREPNPFPEDPPSVNAFYRAVFGSALNVPAAPRAAKPLRRGPKGYGRDHFKKVRDEYQRQLALNPTRPVKATAEKMNASVATAGRWIQRARDMGLIESRTKGRTDHHAKN